MALRPCPACDRHVLLHEARCPFCAARLPGAAGAVARTAVAAAFGFGVAVTGCGDSSGPAPDAAADALPLFDSAYGTPPFDAGWDAGLPEEDAGPPADAGSGDAGPMLDDSGIAPAYGPVPFDGG